MATGTSVVFALIALQQFNPGFLMTGDVLYCGVPFKGSRFGDGMTTTIKDLGILAGHGNLLIKNNLQFDSFQHYTFSSLGKLLWQPAHLTRVTLVPT